MTSSGLLRGGLKKIPCVAAAWETNKGHGKLAANVRFGMNYFARKDGVTESKGSMARKCGGIVVDHRASDRCLFSLRTQDVPHV
jgi:hypothetical protein